jgi:hypothetical protein
MFDVFSLDAVLQTGINENIVLTDSSVSIKNTYAGVFEIINLVDFISRTAIFRPSIIENIFPTAISNFVSGITYFANIFEGVFATTTFLGNAIKPVGVIEPIYPIDVFLRTATTNSSVNEIVTLEDYFSSMRIQFSDIIETVSLSETSLYQLFAVSEIVEDILLADISRALPSLLLDLEAQMRREFTDSVSINSAALLALTVLLNRSKKSIVNVTTTERSINNVTSIFKSNNNI